MKQIVYLYVNFSFSSDMVVRSIGNSLMVILPDLLGKKITNWFELVRPLIAFKFQTVSIITNLAQMRLDTSNLKTADVIENRYRFERRTFQSNGMEAVK